MNKRSPLLTCAAILGFALTVSLVGCASAPAAAGAAGGGSSAGGASIYDPLDDLSLMHSHSADLEFDLKNPAAYPNGDASRVWPTTGEAQNFVYKLKDVSGFSFVVGYYTYKHKDNPELRSFKAFVSGDGKSWTEVPASSEGADNGCWLFTTWRNAQEIPAGSDFVKFEFADKDLHWSTEISEVRVTGR